MNVLLIDNHTLHLPALRQSLQGHKVTRRLYHPEVDLSTDGFDTVILSGGGGEGKEIDDRTPAGDLWYAPQIDLVRRADVPIIGICMGFEVIAAAFGQAVAPMGETIEGQRQLQATRAGLELLGSTELMQYKYHSYSVPRIDDPRLEVLATSSSGVEMIRHRSLPIVATQFHPEYDGTVKLEGLLEGIVPAASSSSRLTVSAATA